MQIHTIIAMYKTGASGNPKLLDPNQIFVIISIKMINIRRSHSNSEHFIVNILSENSHQTGQPKQLLSMSKKGVGTWFVNHPAQPFLSHELSSKFPLAIYIIWYLKKIPPEFVKLKKHSTKGSCWSTKKKKIKEYKLLFKTHYHSIITLATNSTFIPYTHCSDIEMTYGPNLL